ncbi:Hypothetical protein MALK_1110 [Metamycoplasma alkalescens 14918]|uniref:Uncharacterized protein n=1 Tax=Metamycoplasma alkalescens 14918 TaxID=1188234 RepID=N9U0H4_9BACT|nr:Hypothetical protein MALK_1110 [Metamycoplasma alkalescens 14918]
MFIGRLISSFCLWLFVFVAFDLELSQLIAVAVNPNKGPNARKTNFDFFDLCIFFTPFVKNNKILYTRNFIPNSFLQKFLEK